MVEGSRAIYAVLRRKVGSSQGEVFQRISVDIYSQTRAVWDVNRAVGVELEKRILSDQKTHKDAENVPVPDQEDLVRSWDEYLLAE